MEALIKVVPHVSAVNMCKNKMIETSTYQLLPSDSQMEVTYPLERSLETPKKVTRKNLVVFFCKSTLSYIRNATPTGSIDDLMTPGAGLFALPANLVCFRPFMVQCFRENCNLEVANLQRKIISETLSKLPCTCAKTVGKLHFLPIIQVNLILCTRLFSWPFPFFQHLNTS